MDTKLTEKQEEQANQAPGEERRPALQPPDLSKARRKSRIKRVIALVLVAAIVVATAAYLGRASKERSSQAAAKYEIVAAQMRDITVSLEGSGTLKAADSYMVSTLISGEILQAAFEEGDRVSKDDVLYVIDSSDIMTNIERAELTLSQSRNNLDRKLDSQKNLSIRAKEAGAVVSLLVKEGDSVMSGQVVAMVRDSAVMSLVLPFGADDAQRLYIGQPAKVTVDGSFEVLEGTVADISRVDQALAGNMLVRSVTIDVPNPGGLSPSHTATAVVGDFACNSAGAFNYKSDYTVSAATMGEVSRVHVAEGDSIGAGQLLVSLESSTLDMELESARSSVRDAELNLENQNDRLDSYTIKSPIAGTIIEKNYKEGDTLEAGRVLCTVFDLGYLSLTLNIDELDISMVQVGQEAIVTADAAPGREYKGVVTKVNINGTTMNGVTSYPVSIRIDQTEGLLPGMNVDATIRIGYHENVLTVPSGAVLRGNRVLVQTNPSAVASKDDTSGIPAGFEYVGVELGANDDEYIQILSGLAQGDMVAVAAQVQGSFIMTPFGRVEVPAGMGIS